MERSAEEEQRNLLEAEWLDATMAKSRDWAVFRNTRRDYVCQGRQFVAWDLVKGRPRIVDVFKAASVGISWEGGLAIVLNSQQTETQITITSRPRALIPGVFLWIPGFADIRYNPMQYTEPKSVRRLTVPIVARTAHFEMREGWRYFGSMKDFTAQWPGIFQG